ncbi:hypothetical protein, partial [Antiquaquibacter soli]
MGRSYTVSGWLASTDDDTVVTDVAAGVSGVGASTPVTTTAAVSGAVSWVPVTYQFTASATSHEVVVSASSTTSDASVLVDDVAVVQDAWTETDGAVSSDVVP